MTFSFLGRCSRTGAIGAALTGTKVFPWAGSDRAQDCLALGNVLAGPAVAAVRSVLERVARTLDAACPIE